MAVQGSRSIPAAGSDDSRVAVPAVSVIICAYTDERWDAILAAVESVRRQTRPAHSILLVVDHNPGLFERLRAALPDVHVVQNAQQRGLSGARNTGIGAATGDVIAFLDDDAAADEDWLERLGAGYADPRVIGVGGAPLPRWLAGRPRWFPDEFGWVVGCAYRGLPDRAAPVRNFIGANMSFRREVFEVIGGFASGVGRVGANTVSCEDTELCIRVAQTWPDRVLLYEPAAMVRHLVPASRGTWRYFARRCFGEGKDKATVAAMVGARDGLASEWRHTLVTLPRGAARGVLDALGGDVSGLGRMGAICGGLGLATAGYVLARARRVLNPPVDGGAPPESV
ncbi:MAG: glycosyltransferase family 2 protein [Chloroflexota bacterium]